MSILEILKNKKQNKKENKNNNIDLLMKDMGISESINISDSEIVIYENEEESEVTYYDTETE